MTNSTSFHDSKIPFIVLLFFTLYIFSINSFTIKISSFNLKIFGPDKMKSRTIRNHIINIIKEFDIIFLQEIRDVTDVAIYDLLNMVNYGREKGIRYQMKKSERLGSSQSKEEYVYMYRIDKVKVNEVYQYGDRGKWFERSPYSMDMEIDYNGVNYPMFLMGIHVQPSNADNEIQKMYEVWKYYQETSLTSKKLKKIVEKRTIIMGDLNSDCGYLSETKLKNNILYKKFNWLIDEDTTVGNSQCSYDHFALSSEQLNDVVKRSYVFKYDERFGMYSTTAEKISDHYPIVLELDFSHLLSCSIRRSDDKNYLRRSGNMRIFVETISGVTITLGVDSTDTVEQVKQMIEDKEGIPIEHQGLIYGLIALDDNEKTLSDYNIQKDSTLTIILILYRCNGFNYFDLEACSGNGYCYKEDSCLCEHGYSGSDCQYQNISCFGENKYSDGVCGFGTCIQNDVCECSPFYTGEKCDIEVECNNKKFTDVDVCSGNGECSKSGCHCYEGFYGTYCNIVQQCNGLDSTNSAVCSGNGICFSNGNCICDKFTYGDNCEFDKTCYGILHNNPAVCSGNGICSTFNNCTCNLGFSGTSCSVSDYSCWNYTNSNLTVCSGNGVCSQQDTCSCEIGYYDAQCAIILDCGGKNDRVKKIVITLVVVCSSIIVLSIIAVLIGSFCFVKSKRKVNVNRSNSLIEKKQLVELEKI